MESTRSFSVRRAFAGKTVLVTGSTGFIGKVIVEKILRDLPGTNENYVKYDLKKFDERNNSIQLETMK